MRGTEGKVWQLTAIDVASSFGWAELVVAKQGNPTSKQTSKLARRVAAHLETAGWRLERFLSDNGNEFKGKFAETVKDQSVQAKTPGSGSLPTPGTLGCPLEQCCLVD